MFYFLMALLVICVLSLLLIRVYRWRNKVKNKLKYDFIANYQWCVENLEKKGSNLLIDGRLSTDNFSHEKWNYEYPYKLSGRWDTYGFNDLPRPDIYVRNGTCWDTSNEVEFMQQFNKSVADFKRILDSDDLKLLKKYGTDSSAIRKIVKGYNC